jgi:hypothetical protein
MKHIFVERQPSTKDWTLSKFYSDCKTISGVGVEDEKRTTKVKGETCIPAGTYPLDLRISPRFSKEYYRDDDGNLIAPSQRTTPELQQRFHTLHELIWVRNVPGFEFILWHFGNTDDDTEGCYIVGSVFGKVKGQDGVVNSRKKYTDIYPHIWRAIKKDVVNVTYREEHK